MDEDRLKDLARRLDAVAGQNERRIEQEKRIAAVRRERAFELYAICSNLVRNVNALADRGRLELSPPQYSADSFIDTGPNLFQINISGRIVDIAFESTDELTSTESFLTPYTIGGAIRWFNQKSLESLGIRERLLFLCAGRDDFVWTYFDEKTHRQGRFDEEYLMDLLEDLLQ